MHIGITIAPTLLYDNDNDNDNDNEKTLFDHNVQVEITIYKQFKQPNYKLVWRLLLRQINLSLS